MKPLEYFPEKRFREMIEEVGPWNYCIYEKGETIPGAALRQTLDIAHYNSVLAGTGCTGAAYTIMCGDQDQGIVIPAGSPIMIARLLRYDDGHGAPHYNATDQLIFPSKSGDVYRMNRKDAPDHFIEITENSNVISIAKAYNLPDQKSGPVNQYSDKGAKLHVEVVPLDGK